MYWEVVRIRFLMMLAYRVNYYSGIVIYSLNIGVYYFLWMSVYGGNASLGGFSTVEMATYIAVSWMSRAFYFNNLDREIAQEIRDGTVAIQLIRPYPYLAVKAFQGFGEGLFRLLLFSTPGLLVVSLFLPLDLPGDAGVWTRFALSLILGFLVNVEINLLTGLLAFFVLNNQGLIWSKRVMVDLLSGLIIPVSLYPDWARSILVWLPFQAVSYTPNLVLVKGLEGAAYWQAILVQAAWVIALLVPVWLIWKKARKSLVVQGG
ncbi:ABC transporter permease [Staphylospora marina]|uniref:ABC transporter permease n=1 Tax=Staphylospora marina TaxID=2490858 RepID=UPI0019D01C01|nr:ABC-2 family transporter protein [Staphylospora marina]